MSQQRKLSELFTQDPGIDLEKEIHVPFGNIRGITYIINLHNMVALHNMVIVNITVNYILGQ